MYIAMNRFKIRPGHEEDFLEVWRNRDSYLDTVPGFKEFNMLRGPSNEEYSLFVSHSIWGSKEDFENWTRSEAFRKAHAGARSSKDMYLTSPNFEGFEACL
ncbi:antibiotic biosynthesis monooxygenase [Vibrio sp. S4M6]|uniref:antibiotic biosynthesis monooxygenase family protein n=1 Tax=Vibrio sinus TaxID=2946865 RepID=UPI002029C087|nr:antibiotic biosynthesis monooxygenase [Vibrio sinus]MCL9782018.1 antibiotic biosynthesis monooxygenase [Vibrio sinus]